MDHKQCMKSYKNNHSTTKLNAINFYVEGTLKNNDLVKKSVTVEVLYDQKCGKNSKLLQSIQYVY